MKVVIFCGGLGLRLREHSERIPKAMVKIGYRPILWHVMRYYAHYGHREFILCLGYKADVIKRYFLDYDEAMSNDFILDGANGGVELLRRDIQDWEISFVDTGLNATLGDRLCAVRPYLGDDELFLANYADVLTDAPLDELLADFERRPVVASFLSVRPTSYSFHLVRMKDETLVAGLDDVRSTALRINGGYFILRRAIFDYIRPGDELVVEPFARLATEERLVAYPYDGYWAPLDTIKDMRTLEEHHESGDMPWAVWLPR